MGHLEEVRGGRSISPFPLAQIEHLRHWPLGCRIDVQMVETENVLNRSEHVNSGVTLRYDLALFYIRSSHIGSRSMGIDMIGAGLGIIFQNKNERVVFVRTVRHLIH